MKAKPIWIVAGVLVVVAAALFVFIPRTPGDIATGPLASQIPATALGDIGSVTSSLPPSAAGAPSGQAPAPVAKALPAPPVEMGGTNAKGRVERMFVRVAEGVLVDLAVALPDQRDGWKYAAIEFPEPLANGATLVRAHVDTGDEVKIGDIVEMRFAHKRNRSRLVKDIFPTTERDRVTSLVAKSGTELAQDFQRRIVARKSADAAAEQVADVGAWKKLPLEQAVKIVHGSGKRQLAVFTDPFCQACQAFEQALEQMDDVTVYVFMLPVIRPERSELSKRVWCSPDRARAWIELVRTGKAPVAAPDCANPIDANIALLQPYGIRATPTILFEDGRRAQGAWMASALRDRIALAASAQAKAN